jgi:hypothetical protein
VAVATALTARRRCRRCPPEPTSPPTNGSASSAPTTTRTETAPRPTRPGCTSWDGPTGIVGGNGADSLFGGTGDDTLIGGLKRRVPLVINTLDGGDGTDTRRWPIDILTNCD